MRAKLQAQGLDQIELQVGRNGVFDVTIDGRLAFSRHKVGRFPTDAEIDDLITN